MKAKIKLFINYFFIFLLTKKNKKYFSTISCLRKKIIFFLEIAFKNRNFSRKKATFAFILKNPNENYQDTCKSLARIKIVL